jgi:hypothetical protein
MLQRLFAALETDWREIAQQATQLGGSTTAAAASAVEARVRQLFFQAPKVGVAPEIDGVRQVLEWAASHLRKKPGSAENDWNCYPNVMSEVRDLAFLGASATPSREHAVVGAILQLAGLATGSAAAAELRRGRVLALRFPHQEVGAQLSQCDAKELESGKVDVGAAETWLESHGQLEKDVVTALRAAFHQSQSEAERRTRQEAARANAARWTTVAVGGTLAIALVVAAGGWALSSAALNRMVASATRTQQDVQASAERAKADARERQTRLTEEQVRQNQALKAATTEAEAARAQLKTALEAATSAAAKATGEATAAGRANAAKAQREADNRVDQLRAEAAVAESKRAAAEAAEQETTAALKKAQDSITDLERKRADLQKKGDELQKKGDELQALLASEEGRRRSCEADTDRLQTENARLKKEAAVAEAEKKNAEGERDRAKAAVEPCPPSSTQPSAPVAR